MTIGATLRQAREQCSLSLRRLSERTRIRVRVLRAIEQDDFHHAPDDVVMRGYLRLYAREVGLDPEGIAARYFALADADRPGRHGGSDRAGTPGLLDTTTRARGGGRIGLRAAAAAAAAAAIGVAYATWGRPANRVADVAVVDVPATSGAPVGPVASAPLPAPAAAPMPVSGVLKIDLRATADCWVSATADGQQVAYRLVRAGERLALRVTMEAVLRIGVPANLSVTIDDVPIRPLPRPGTPATLRITPANYRELLGQ